MKRPEMIMSHWPVDLQQAYWGVWANTVNFKEVLDIFDQMSQATEVMAKSECLDGRCAVITKTSGKLGFRFLQYGSVKTGDVIYNKDDSESLVVAIVE